MDARDGVHLERPTAARVDRPAGVDGGPARPHRRWQEPIDDAGGAARGVPIGSSSVGWRLALGGARGRIQRSTVGSTDAAHSPLSPLSPLGPVEPRVRLAVGRSLGVIRRVVEKTQVGSKRNPQTKYYSSEDPNPFNPKMFDTYEEAAAYDSRLVTAKNTKPASSPTTAAAVTVDKPSAVPAKPAAVPAKPATTSAPPVPATKVPEKEPEPPS